MLDGWQRCRSRLFQAGMDVSRLGAAHWACVPRLVACIMLLCLAQAAATTCMHRNSRVARRTVRVVGGYVQSRCRATCSARFYHFRGAGRSAVARCVAHSHRSPMAACLPARHAAPRVAPGHVSSRIKLPDAWL
jgi:hypothetical protein